MNITVPPPALLAATVAVTLVISSALASEATRRDRVVWVSLEGDGELAKVDVAEGVLRRVNTRGGGPHRSRLKAG